MVVHLSWPSRDAGPSRAATPNAPPSLCPACRSTAIASVSRNPDENAYWRCDSCGEVWNASRRNQR